MFKPFALAFFIAFFVWVGSIVVSTDPHERLHRAATPIALLGKATVALVVQVEPEWAAPTYNFFLKTEYGFKYMLWSVFYEEEWRTGQALPPGGAASAPAAARLPSEAASASGHAPGPIARYTPVPAVAPPAAVAR
jgi:hypothetical protein